MDCLEGKKVMMVGVGVREGYAVNPNKSTGLVEFSSIYTRPLFKLFIFICSDC